MCQTFAHGKESRFLIGWYHVHADHHFVPSNPAGSNGPIFPPLSLSYLLVATHPLSIHGSRPSHASLSTSPLLHGSHLGGGGAFCPPPLPSSITAVSSPPPELRPRVAPPGTSSNEFATTSSSGFAATSSSGFTATSSSEVWRRRQRWRSGPTRTSRRPGRSSRTTGRWRGRDPGPDVKSGRVRGRPHVHAPSRMRPEATASSPASSWCSSTCPGSRAPRGRGRRVCCGRTSTAWGR